MAGIGFRLRKYFTDSTLLGNIKGSIYSIIISSGPWLICVMSVAFISYFAQLDLENKELYVLKSIICYTYAASLVIFGAVEMPLTRYLADKLYIHDQSTFRNVFLTVVVFFVLLGTFLGGIFYSYFDFDIMFRLICITFFVSVLVIWLTMVFLSAAKNYHHIVTSFVLGGMTSICLGIIGGHYLGLFGYVAGYSAGQVAIALFLTRNLFCEFQDVEYISFEFVGYFGKYRRMIFVGLFYYLGTWVDKFVFWFAGVGDHVMGLFYTNQYYDTAMFLSYLTIVPAFAVFLVQVETNFYVKYTYFFRSIEQKNDLNFLNDSVLEIIEALRTTLVNLLKVQTFISLSCWYFAPQIMTFLRLPAMMEIVFKYGVVAAYLQVLFLIFNIVMLYFEDSKAVLKTYLVFFFSNLIFSYVTVHMGFKYWGFGYLLSTLMTFIVSFFHLDRTLKSLNFYTFMRQPLSRKNMSEQL